MSSKLLEELNVPFTGGPTDALSRMRLRYLKSELKENPSVNLRYIRQGVREFLPGMQKLIDQLPMGSNLLVMPSTTQRNRIPVMLASELLKLRPDLVLINLKEKEVQVAHRTESKIKGNYLVRSSDHRHFSISDKLVAAADRLNRTPTFILDDSISTGDSAIMLHRELLRSGIYPRGIVTAVANEKYHVRESDLRRVYQKMLPDRPINYAEESLKKDLFTTFAGFPRKKIANFEIAFSTGELRKQKELAFRYVQQSAAYMEKQKLGPAEVLQRKQTLAKKGMASSQDEKKEADRALSPSDQVVDQTKPSKSRGPKR